MVKISREGNFFNIFEKIKIFFTLFIFFLKTEKKLEVKKINKILRLKLKNPNFPSLGFFE
jgi:hypothetical protein